MNYSREELEKLPDKELWRIEARLGAQLSSVSEVINDRIRKYVADGWSQARIAEKVGRKQRTISDRMAKLGLEPNGPAGRPRAELAPAANPAPGELTDRQKKAIELVKEGKSYKQIGRELGTDESNIRKDPIIRAVRQEFDAEEVSEVTGGSLGACYVRQPPEMYRYLKSEIELLLSPEVRLNSEYRIKFSNLFKKALEGVEKK